MSERPIFDPKAPVIDQRNREWVELDTGWVCVWELEAADMLFIVERSVRPGREKAEVSTADTMLWRIIVSCYRGDEPGAARVFDLTDMPRINKLRKSEWDRLLEAIERVNGLNAEAVPELKDFTRAVPGGQRHSSKRSASNTSTG